MPKQMFISPKAALAALEATKPIIEVELIEDLGPSAPHDQPALEAVAVGWIPEWPKAEPSPHYTNTLDQLWPEFDDLEERTAVRLQSLLGETVIEAERILKLKIQVWEDLDAYELDEAEQERFDKEFLAYLRRLNEYRTALADLDSDSTDTEEVYIGLVKRQDGAGPVPDAIMHMYFADQLGILADHAEDMGKGYIGRIMTALDKVDTAIDETADEIHEAVEHKTEKIRELMDDARREARDDLRKIGLWVGGAIAGTLLLGGAITAGVVLATKGRDE